MDGRRWMGQRQAPISDVIWEDVRLGAGGMAAWMQAR